MDCVAIRNTPFSWKQKALFDFNVPLEYAPEAQTPAQKYALLKKEYDQVSESLLIRLIRGGLLPQALDLYNRFTPKCVDDDEILMAAVKSERADILSAFAQRLDPNYPYIAREAYLETVRMNRPDLTLILNQYYSPRTDPELSGLYKREIVYGDLSVVKHLEPFVQRDPQDELESALRSGRPEIIEYFSEKYPHLLRDPVVVNDMAEEFIRFERLSALKELVRRAGRLINLNALLQGDMLIHPRIRNYLNTL